MREKLRYSWVLVLVGLLGCDLFTPREPEAPVAESGTFLQPDTPERVVENLQAAIAERNAGNYVRSLAEDFAFVPTASAQSRDPALWAGWNRAREEQYFTAMVAAVTPSATPQLQLSNQTASFESESRYVLEATYRLTVPHTRRMRRPSSRAGWSGKSSSNPVDSGRCRAGPTASREKRPRGAT